MPKDIISCQVGLVLLDFASQIPTVSIIKKASTTIATLIVTLSFYTLFYTV